MFHFKPDIKMQHLGSFKSTGWSWAAVLLQWITQQMIKGYDIKVVIIKPITSGNYMELQVHSCLTKMSSEPNFSMKHFAS